MKNITEFITENRNWKGFLDKTLYLDKYPDVYKVLLKYIKKYFSNPSNIYLVFKNIEEAQSWTDFTYLPINGEKFSKLEGNYSTNSEIYNSAKTYLGDVTNIDILKDIDKNQKDFPFLSISGYNNRVKIVFSNRMKVDKYDITAYLIEI